MNTQFKIGDKVRFLNETGEGIVKKISGNTVKVEIEDGFEIPFPANQLVKIFTGTAEVIAPEVGPEEIDIPNLLQSKTFITHVNPKEFDKSVYIAFEPVDHYKLLDSSLNLILINNTDYNLYYSVSTKKEGNFFGVFAGELDKGIQLDLITIKRADIEKWSTLKVQLLFHKKGEHIDRSPLDELLRLKPVKFYKESTYNVNPFTDNKAFIINLEKPEGINSRETESWDGEGIEFENLALHSLTKERGIEPGSRSKPHLKNTGLLEKEVDLHIEELLNDFRGMTNAEIIQYQLRYFQKELEEAIANHMQRIVFIHGVGNGRLKGEVRRILETYHGVRYHDASYQRYGFGATEVVIK